MAQIISISPNHSTYPQSLQRYWTEQPLPTLSAIGDLQLLQTQPLTLFYSVQCPGDLILKTYDLARHLRDTGQATISGFHSPMEKECLSILLRGNQPVIYCPARSLDKMRLQKKWKRAIANGHLLVLSPFPAKQHRVTVTLAQIRNQLVSALAEAVFVSYAAPESKTEVLAKQVITCGKLLLTFDTNGNQRLLSTGAQAIHWNL